MDDTDWTIVSRKKQRSKSEEKESSKFEQVHEKEKDPFSISDKKITSRSTSGKSTSTKSELTTERGVRKGPIAEKEAISRVIHLIKYKTVQMIDSYHNIFSHLIVIPKKIKEGIGSSETSRFRRSEKSSISCN
jgi:chromosome condensin MukBEF ATPase and DNA-binding subunit MukB